MDLKDFTPEQLRKMTIQPSKDRRSTPAPDAPKPSKYRNVKCEADGFTFDSRHEADMWLLLKSREQLGDITRLRRQVAYPIYVPVFGSDGKPLDVRAELCVYVADFEFYDKAGKRVTMDAKGQKKRICPYPLKAKAMMLSYGIEIQEV